MRPELWIRKVGLFCFEGQEVTFSCLEMNDGSRPVQVQVDAERGKRFRRRPGSGTASLCR